MKKIIALALALSLVFALVSCGNTISGTYSIESFGIEVSLKFSGNKVELTADTVVGEITNKGTYEITKDDDGDQMIKFTFDEDVNKALDKIINWDGSVPFEKVDGGIKIAGIKWEKE